MKSDKNPDLLAREFALRRLNKRECSSQDIYQNLIRKGVSPSIATQVVEDLIHSGLINDERFTKMMTRAQIARGKGPQVIRQKLKEKGIQLKIEEIKTISEEITQSTELKDAYAVLERRYPQSFQDRALTQRAYQALLRRGFSYDAVKKALELQKINARAQEE